MSLCLNHSTNCKKCLIDFLCCVVVVHKHTVSMNIFFRISGHSYKAKRSMRKISRSEDIVTKIIKKSMISMLQLCSPFLLSLTELIINKVSWGAELNKRCCTFKIMLKRNVVQHLFNHWLSFFIIYYIGSKFIWLVIININIGHPLNQTNFCQHVSQTGPDRS